MNKVENKEIGSDEGFETEAVLDSTETKVDMVARDILRMLRDMYKNI
ncbi:MAG: hypothetical protein RL235_358 [Chlamydiota bacterium]|jgi:hypothetical protein